MASTAHPSRSTRSPATAPTTARATGSSGPPETSSPTGSPAAADQHADRVTRETPRAAPRRSTSSGARIRSGRPASVSRRSSPGAPCPETWTRSQPAGRASTARSRSRVTPYCSVWTSTARPARAASVNTLVSASRSRRRFSARLPSGRLNSASTRTGRPDRSGRSLARSPARPSVPHCVTRVTSWTASGRPWAWASSRGTNIRRRAAGTSLGTTTRTTAGAAASSAGATGPRTSAPIHVPTSRTISRSRAARTSGAACRRRYPGRSTKASYWGPDGSSRTSCRARTLPSGATSTHRQRSGPAKSSTCRVSSTSAPSGIAVRPRTVCAAP
ncbi:hypothetical protein T45_02110 [Streptomyces turgidiscabies]|nr:hypothetical protein T45_02110 [Streptomyces turgidiscabies]